MAQADSYLLHFNFDPELPESIVEIPIGDSAPVLDESDISGTIGSVLSRFRSFELQDGIFRMQLSSVVTIPGLENPDIGGTAAEIVDCVETEARTQDSPYGTELILNDATVPIVELTDEEHENTTTTFSHMIGGRMWHVSTCFMDADPQLSGDPMTEAGILVTQHTFALNALSTAIATAHDGHTATHFKKLTLALGEDSTQGKKEASVRTPKDRFDEFVGIDTAIQELREFVRMANIPRHVLDVHDIEQPQVALLYGPQGVGKTELMSALGDALGAKVKPVSFSDVQNIYVGQWAANLQKVFNEAYKSKQRVLIVLDEMDGLTNCGNPDVTRNVNSVLKRALEEVKRHPHVFVVGATNEVEEIDPVVRADKRMPLKIGLQLPETEQRARIFEKLLSGGALAAVTLDDDFISAALEDAQSKIGDLHFSRLAELTDEFSGGDIREVVQAAKRACLLDAYDGQTPDKPMQVMPTQALLEAIIARKKTTRS